MRESLFHLRQRPGVSIQASIREMLVSVILNEQLPADRPLPSCRELARRGTDAFIEISEGRKAALNMRDGKIVNHAVAEAFTDLAHV